MHKINGFSTESNVPWLLLPVIGGLRSHSKGAPEREWAASFERRMDGSCLEHVWGNITLDTLCLPFRPQKTDYGSCWGSGPGLWTPNIVLLQGIHWWLQSLGTSCPDWQLVAKMPSFLCSSLWAPVEIPPAATGRTTVWGVVQIVLSSYPELLRGHTWLWKEFEKEENVSPWLFSWKPCIVFSINMDWVPAQH